MADVSKVNVNSTDYNIKDSNAMHKGVDRVTAGQSIIAPIGTASTADGFAVNASGDYSHASGFHTIAASDVQHVIGKYNEEDANGTYPFIIGGGRLDTDRKNIFTVDWNGDVNAGRSNGLTNDTKLPTGADVISYLNSNIVNDYVFISVTTTANGCIDINNAPSLHFEHGSSMPPVRGWIPVVINHATRPNSLDVVTADGQSWFIYSDTSQKTYIMFYKIAYRSS